MMERWSYGLVWKDGVASIHEIFWDPDTEGGDWPLYEQGPVMPFRFASRAAAIEFLKEIIDDLENRWVDLRQDAGVVEE